MSGPYAQMLLFGCKTSAILELLEGLAEEVLSQVRNHVTTDDHILALSDTLWPQSKQQPSRLHFEAFAQFCDCFMERLPTTSAFRDWDSLCVLESSGFFRLLSTYPPPFSTPGIRNPMLACYYCDHSKLASFEFGLIVSTLPTAVSSYEIIQSDLSDLFSFLVKDERDLVIVVY